MPDERADILMEFVRSSVLDDAAFEFRTDSRLLADGVLDSMGLVMLAAFVEERFGVQVPDASLRDGELETIGDIVTFLDRHG